jgi:1-acyl-sn-glycerol-3-phosphate acyltransferase
MNQFALLKKRRFLPLFLTQFLGAFDEETWRLFQLVREDRAVFLSVLGISWFWFLGSLFLAQLPGLTVEVIGGSEHVVTLLLTVFSLGVGLGSLACHRLSRGRSELGLVPLSALGVTLFIVDLFFALPATPAALQPVEALALMAQGYGIRLLVDLFMIGAFGGLYIVPLYAVIQEGSAPGLRARVIAANNVVNAAFMVAAALFAIALGAAGLTARELFLVVSAVNLAVAIYIASLLPELVIRFLLSLFVRAKYRVLRRGLANIPKTGGAVLVCNHVSFIDPVIIGVMCDRPVRFVMHYDYYKMPVLNWVCRAVGAIPVATRAANAKVLARALDAVALALDRGEVVCIFPEGKLTLDGALNPFKSGVERIIRRTPVPVIPMALKGLWGSFFSRKPGHAINRWQEALIREVELVCGAPISPEQVTAAYLQSRVQALGGSTA